jgi:glycosyltransferase involved in cell wall biosynthesis
MPSDRRPRVLAALPSLFPSTVIGVAKPLLRLHLERRIDLDLTLQLLVSRRAVARADVVVLCHTIDPQHVEILDWVRDCGRPLLYEIDDNLLDLPADVPGLDYLRTPDRRAALVRCLRQAAIVRVYSPALADALSAQSANIQIVSGPLDWSLIPPSLPPRPAGPVRLVYATSRRDDDVGKMLVDPLRRVLDARPDVELTIWGPRHDELASHPRARRREPIRDYDDFFRQFAIEQFDIGLAPLPDDLFHRCKSNNKFREYAATGVAGVYSDMPVYNTCVEHERTGLLAANTAAAWVSAVERLVIEASLRRSIQERARDYARQHFNEQVTSREWLEAIQSLAARPAPATPAVGRGGPAGRLLKHLGGLAGKTGPALRRHGLKETWRRAVSHADGFRQWWAWEVSRRRLEQRIHQQGEGRQ